MARQKIKVLLLVLQRKVKKSFNINKIIFFKKRKKIINE